MMSVQEQINADIKDAMKAKNVDKLAALRAVKSAIMLEATKEGIPEVSDEISLKLIAKLVKQRKDSAAIFTEQNRPDLAIDEVNQLAYLAPYLPVQMGDSSVYNSAMNAFKLEQWEQSYIEFSRFRSDTAIYFASICKYHLQNLEAASELLVKIPENSVFFYGCYDTNSAHKITSRQEI